ncbi:MAG: HD domain-containing protein [Bradymonadaceae bacterium]|nr:HD domain-containing protein [Lujinxingiaceae bacterium]
MNKIFVSDLCDNSHVQSVFLVTQKSVRETKNGDPYMSVTLGDRSGNIEARAWDNVPALDSRFEIDDFVVIRGRVSKYRDQLQIALTDIDRVAESEVALGDFLPQSRWIPDDLLAQLIALLDSALVSPELRRFFDILFADKERVRLFSSAPAAMTNHHNFIGGLVEHTLSMARIGVDLSAHYGRYYPGLINPDLVLAGCVLHDFGKCWELSFGRSFSYSTCGKLLGHIVQGVELISTVAREATPGFDDHMLTQLKHLVLSHHGHLEFGSPVLPRTPEAMLLHEIDMIDSRMAMAASAIARHGDGAAATNGREWSDYSRIFEGSIYMGSAASANWEVREDIDPQTLTGPGRTRSDDAASSGNGEARGDNGSVGAESKKSEPGSSASSNNLSLF